MMEAQSVGSATDEAALLQCITELKKEDRSDLATIQSTMLEKHSIDHKQTMSILETLKNSARIFTLEQKGVVTYMTIKPQHPIKKSKSVEAKETGILVIKCVKAINQGNDSSGASFEDIQQWLQSNGGAPSTQQLQKILDTEISYMRLKRNETGLYFPAKKRGRPYGSPSTSKRGGRLPSASALKRSPDETSKRAGNLGKRKRIKKSNEDYEFYDTPGNTTMQLMPATSSEPLCDFCLKSASCNRQNMFEELLLCKDCNAKAHPSCMGYSEILARRASLGPWQCIDCKTCCRCLESGNPDDLLFCDACDKGYHMFCHDPAIKEKPKNKWACNACIDDGVIPDDLLTNSSRASDEAAPAADSVFNEASNPADGAQSNVSVDPVEGSGSVTSASPGTNEVQSPVYPSPKIVLPEVPSHWTVTHVSQYIQQSGFPVEAQKFYEQEIDGKSLMLLMRQDVLCHMNLKLGPALKIYEKIKVLQKGPAVRSQAQ